MFPSREDVAVHRRTRARLKKEELASQRRAGEIRTPAQLSDFIIEEVRTRYRKGKRSATITFSVPITNFLDWAADAKFIGRQDTVYVKQLISRPLTRLTKTALKQELGQNAIAPSIISKFECTYGTDLTFEFEVKITVLGSQ